MKLSVALIVKNEEEMLKDCLETVKGADEIVICDTGSTDKTIEIAKKYTDKVFTDYQWNDHFGEAYTHAFSKCTGDWILSIDADGRLERNGIKKIKDLIQVVPKEYDSISYHIVKPNGLISHTLPRICKKGTKWKYRVHANPLVKRSFKSDIRVTAFYSPTHKKDPNRALRMLELQREEMPDDTRTMFYLAREYSYKKRYVDAVELLDEYLGFNTWRAERAEAYLLKAKCLWRMNRGEQARQSCLQAIYTNPEFKEAFLFMSAACYEPMRSTWSRHAENCFNTDVLFHRVD